MATGMHGAGGEYYHDRIGLPALDLGMSRERGSSCPYEDEPGRRCLRAGLLACLHVFLVVCALLY